MPRTPPWKLLHAFDKALAGEPAPQIETFLLQADPQDRPELLQDLIVVEHVHRATQGRSSTRQSYYARFPDQTHLIDTSFEEARRQLALPSGDRYTDYRRLGGGQFGTVYEAHDTKLQRQVALKIPTPAWRSDPDAAGRLLAEARKQARLEHAGIVGIYDVGPTHSDPTLFISMEYVEGQPLDAAVAVPAQADRAARIVADLADAVAYAHGEGVIHSDLKPANALLDRQGRTHITDFGLARRSAEILRQADGGALSIMAASATATTSLLGGTPAYMAPEQWSAGPADPRSDVWALGVILHQLLTGRLPIPGSLPEIQQVIGERPSLPSPRHWHREVHRELDRITMRCLAYRADERYASAAVLGRDLRWWLDRRRRVRRRVVIAVSTVLAVSATAAAWQWQEHRKQLAAAANQAQRDTEEGRQQLLTGSNRLALPRLQSAFGTASRLGRPDPALRFLLQRAQAAAGSELRTFGSQEVPLTACRFSENGQFLAAVGRDKRVTVFDTLSQRPLFRTDPLPDPPSYAAFDRSGSRVLVTAGPRVQVWGWRDHQLLLDNAEHDLDIRWAAFSADGASVATASVDNTARVWNLAKPPPVLLKGHTRSVVCCAFNPAGDRVVTTSLDGTARIWRALDGRPEKLFRLSRVGILQAEFSPDGRSLLTLTADPHDPIRIWDIEHESVSAPLDPTARTIVAGPVYVDQGNRCLIAVFAGDPNSVDVWDILARKKVATLVGHSAMVSSVDFNANGTRLATGSADKTARLWDVTSERTLSVIECPEAQAFATVRLSHDESALLSAGDAGAWVLHDLTGASLLAARPDVVLAAHRDQFLVRDGRGDVSLEQGPAGRTALPDTYGVTCAAFSPDGRQFALAGRTADTVYLGTVPSGVLRKLTVVGAADGVRFDASGRRLLVVGSRTPMLKHTISVVDVGTGTVERSFTTSALQVLATTFDNTGQPLAVLDAYPDRSQTRDLEVRRIADGTLVRVLSNGPAMPIAGAFSPDARRVVLGDSNCGATVWDLATGKIACTVTGHAAAFVNAAVFSPDGTFFATGGADRTVKVWDAASGKLLANYAAHPAPVATLLWTDDGHLLATCADGSTRCWDVRIAADR